MKVLREVRFGEDGMERVASAVVKVRHNLACLAAPAFLLALE